MYLWRGIRRLRGVRRRKWVSGGILQAPIRISAVTYCLSVTNARLRRAVNQPERHLARAFDRKYYPPPR